MSCTCAGSLVLYKEDLFDTMRNYPGLEEKLRQSMQQRETMRRVAQKLVTVPLFSGVDDQNFMKELGNKLRPRSMEPGDLLIAKGSAGEEMFFVVEGSVEVFLDGDDPIASLESGTFFGEAALMSAEPRTATVRAATAGQLYVLTKEDLFSTLKAFPGLEEAIRGHMGQRETMRRVAQKLVTVPLFSGVDDQNFMKELGNKLRPRSMEPGDLLIAKGSAGEEMFFVVEGSVEVFLDGDDPIASLESGTFFGEAALMSAEPRTATVRAATAGQLYVLTKEDLFSTLKAFPGLEEAIRGHMGQREAARSASQPPSPANSAGTSLEVSWQPSRRTSVSMPAFRCRFVTGLFACADDRGRGLGLGLGLGLEPGMEDIDKHEEEEVEGEYDKPSTLVKNTAFP